MRLMICLRWWVCAIAIAEGLAMGCGTRSAWSRDESERIEQILKAEKFSDELPGAAGTGVYAAAPAAAPSPSLTYELQNSRAKPPSSSRRGSGKSHDRARAQTEPGSSSAKR